MQQRKLAFKSKQPQPKEEENIPIINAPQQIDFEKVRIKPRKLEIKEVILPKPHEAVKTY